MEPKPASQSGALLARWMGIGDANSQGNVHGGTIMKLADEAAGVAAIKHSRKRVVTGKPTEVPPVVATTPQEQRRMREAELRRKNRLGERAQILEQRERSGH